MAELTQVEIDGIAKLKTDLADAGAVMIEDKGFYTKAGDRIHRVAYSELNDDIVSETKIASITQVGSEMKYYGFKPNILRTVVSTPQRSPIIAEAQIRNGFANRFPDESIINLNISIQGDEDVVFIESDDSVENIIKERSIKVWTNGNGNPQWQVKNS